MTKVWKYIKSRLPLLLLSLCIITSAVASLIYAKYVDDQSNNAEIDITVDGTLVITVSPGSHDTGVYTITNDSTSTIPAYVRFAVVVNWQDGEGNLWAIPPKATEYTITAENCTLLLDDGYYYYNGIRNPSEGFAVTVERTDSAKAPNGYDNLHVQIVAEGIQSVPLSAAGNAWGYKYENNAWSVYTDTP